MTKPKFYDWRDEYAVGIEEIDAQHRNLFMLVKRLHALIEEGKGGQTLFNNFLNQLIQYTQTHFTDEEAFMKKNDAPQAFFDEHVKEHRDLVQQVLEIRKEWEQEHHVFTPKVTMFLVDWLRNHIVNTDHKISDHIKTQTDEGTDDT